MSHYFNHGRRTPAMDAAYLNPPGSGDPRKRFLIRNEMGEWWSNESGWGDYSSATRFTKFERDTFNLPMGGSWRMFG